MKVLMLTVALTALASVAHSRAYADTAQIPCASVQSVVRDMGAVVLNTGNGQFDRLVRDASFCSARQLTEQVFTVSLDDRYCPAGLRCEDPVN